MKKIGAIILIVLGVGLAFYFNQQNGTKTVTESGLISTSGELQSIPFQELLLKGDVDGLGKYFAEDVFMIVPGAEDDFSKAEAIEKLRNFISMYPPQNYKLRHEGKSASGKGKYFIGMLTTGNGNFKTYLMTQNEKIEELRFEQ